VFTDISESKAQAQRLDYLARHDPLTNLPNRLALDADLVAAINTAVPGIDRMALLIIDLDNFKTINDSLGHAPAIACWRTGASPGRPDGPVQAALPAGRRRVRVFIDDLPGEESVIELANRLIRVIGESVDLDGHVLHTTPSIGISLYPEDGRDAQALIRNADTAMYHAKANGRANYKFFTEPMNAAATSACIWRANCGARWPITSWCCTTSRRSTCSAARWSASRRWCAGATRSAAWSAGRIHSGRRGMRIDPAARPLGAAHRLPPGQAWLDRHRHGRNGGQYFRPPVPPAGFVQSVRGMLAETGCRRRLELEITESTIMHGVDEAIRP
jgi:GGDEF domain-containing protein